MKRNRIARIWGSAAILSAILLGTAACSVDGTPQLPDFENVPSLTIPTRDPVPDPDNPGGEGAEPQPPAQPEEPPAAEPEQPPAAEPEAPPAAEPDVAPGPEAPVGPLGPEEGILGWWLLLIVAAASVIVAIIVRARGRAGRAWDEQLGVASKSVTWAESSLVPQVLAAATASDAAAIWTAARPRVLEIDEQLHTLVTDAATEPNRERATELREAFAAFVSAVDAETSSNAKTTADGLRALRIDVDNSRARVRAALLTPAISEWG